LADFGRDCLNIEVFLYFDDEVAKPSFQRYLWSDLGGSPRNKAFFRLFRRGQNHLLGL